ncbi:MAG: hypothetical protein DLM59_10020 [Pseudonocardiales bacterium]|nr:MAG: hypothetical protein DLM59_10020 [Pseudonocardiales bacterium]
MCVLVILLGAVADAAVITLAGGRVHTLVLGRDQPVCGGFINDPVRDMGHRPEGTRIEYPTAPPSSGPHYPIPADPQTWFYAASTAPPVERLVHNLEHGYTLVWYDDTIKSRQLDDLRSLAGRLGADPGKVIVAAWDTGHGSFPSGQHVALAHWSAHQGHRQYCRRASTAAINTFVNRYPRTDAPEPSGQ